MLCGAVQYTAGGTRTAAERICAVARYNDISSKADHGDIFYYPRLKIFISYIPTLSRNCKTQGTGPLRHFSVGPQTGRGLSPPVHATARISTCQMIWMSSTAGLKKQHSHLQQPPLPHTCTTDKKWRAPEKHHWTLIGPPAVCLQSKQVCGWCIQHGTVLHPAASGQTRDVHCSHQIQSVSKSDGGSASKDNLYSSYSPECQRSPGHVDEPQRQIPREDPITKTAIRKRPLEPVEPLQSDFAAVGTNCWFVWLEGIWPPDWAWFLPRVFLHCHRWSFGSLLLPWLA